MLPHNLAHMDIQPLIDEVKSTGRYRLLSEKTGMSESWLSKFGRGLIQNPTIQTLASVRAGLDVVNGKRRRRR